MKNSEVLSSSALSALEHLHPLEIIEWACDNLEGTIAMTSSFQMQSLPLLHIVSQVSRPIPVLFLDTGYHFPETLAFRDKLAREWGLKVVNVRRHTTEDTTSGTAEPMYLTDPDMCCDLHKVEPMQQATQGLDVWISGIRRDQSAARANAQIAELSDGFVRLHPMATWTRKDIWQYINKHNLPEHPLFQKGYLSIGCAPCTAPVFGDSDERAGRWQGRKKVECGLHTTMRSKSLDS